MGAEAFRAKFFEGGEVRLALLSLLSEGPKNGYQLMKELKERSGGMYRASAGTVYPTLQMLEDEGMIVAEMQEGRRLLRLTELGKTELDRDPEAVKRIWERAKNWEEWGKHFSPDMWAFAGPLKEVTKSTWRAAKWAAGHPDRDTKVRELLQRLSRELGDLVKE